MKFLLVATIISHLAVLGNADGVIRSSGYCGNNQRSGISVTLDGELNAHGVVVPSGAPVFFRVHGVATSEIAFDDVKLQVKVKPTLAVGQGMPHGVEARKIELDLCTDVVGVTCPLKKGTDFDGLAQWNVVEIPEGEAMHVDARVTVSVVAPTIVPCVPKHEFLLVVGHTPNGISEAELREQPAIGHGLVNSINSRDAVGWIAEQSSRFDGYSVEDARRIAGGTVMRGQANFEELLHRRYVDAPSMVNTAISNGNPDPESFRLSAERRLRRTYTDRSHGHLVMFFDPVADVIPDNFDAREAFPGCADVIGRVRDQSDCGSCWAFASTEAFNDRRCVALQGKPGSLRRAVGASQELAVLSAEDTTACCHGFSCGLSMGCNGGQPSSAWRWFTRTGVVTGGDYADVGKGTTCKPYEFMPCAHHVDPQASGYPVCPDGEYPTPACVTECSEGTFGGGYEADKKMAKEAYSLGGMENIQRDMMKYGSVTAAFSVYADFLTYKSGVYNHVEGGYMGGHAVKIIGWGVDEDSGQDYWLVANSWNPSWGEGGLFRILRGVNECGIESQIVAGEVL